MILFNIYFKFTYDLVMAQKIISLDFGGWYSHGA